ncbi:hypothetical protein KCU99_g172, partial [Aureobasidium melanogenum]
MDDTAAPEDSVLWLPASSQQPQSSTHTDCSRKVKGDDAKEYPFCIGAEELLQGDPEALSLVPDYIL